MLSFSESLINTKFNFGKVKIKNKEVNKMFIVINEDKVITAKTLKSINKKLNTSFKRMSLKI